MEDPSCDLLEHAWNALASDSGATPVKTCVLLMLAVVALTFVASTLSGNYSQVDKLWSIVPVVYCWILVCDDRTRLMAVVATVWGCRLTWNFHRRGGYRWPPWDGDEDYRWKHLQDGRYLTILKNRVAWHVFNFAFVSLYQNVLLLLLVGPSIAAHLAASSCDVGVASPFPNACDVAATFLVLLFVLVESVADEQQRAFQTEKHRRIREGEALTGEHADGFRSSGLFAIVRKPNYAAEQAIWISFYFYGVGAFGGGEERRWLDWSVVGCLLLCALFVGSGRLTERITLSKYPKYARYMEEVPLYVPNPMRLLAGAARTAGGGEKTA